MEHETRLEEGVSRRKFLKLGGLFGLALGALSLPSLGWGETANETSDMDEGTDRLAARSKRRSRKVRSRKGRKSGRKRTQAAEGRWETTEANG